MILRDMCPDCQHPYSVHGHGGEGENAYPVCPPDFRDEASGTIAAEVLRQKAEAWDEGHHAGHEDARAVHPTYPDPTPNPYRAA